MHAIASPKRTKVQLRKKKRKRRKKKKGKEIKAMS
jgi:hypothetical protein